MKHFTIMLLCATALASPLTAQPNKPVSKAELLKLTGKFKKSSLSKDAVSYTHLTLPTKA